MAESPETSRVFDRPSRNTCRRSSLCARSSRFLERIAAEMTRAVLGGSKSAVVRQMAAARPMPSTWLRSLWGAFRRERKGLASIALTTDTSILTSISNDYG